MAIEITQTDTATLLGFYREVPAPTNYFRSLMTTSVVMSDDEYIDFEKLVDGRKLAPLVVPMAQGRPMYNEAAKMQRLKPAYVKPKDPISPARALKRRPGESLMAPNTMTPRARFLAILGDILRVHRDGIERRLEWLCAEAALYGKVTLSAPDYPTTVVDFQRDPSHTVTLTGAGIAWNDPDAPILDQINAWVEKIRRAPFGGPVTRVTMGKDVVQHFLANKQVQATRDLLKRGTDGTPQPTIRSGEYSEKIFTVGNLEFWTNSDFYDLPGGGGTKDYMAADGVLLSGPNVNMVEAYGAIMDVDVLRAMAVFIKQFKIEDPSAWFVLSQCAPLFVPVNPNNTLFAKVIDPSL